MSDVPETERELTLIEHLLELRSRILKALVAVLVVLLALVPFARPLYTLFSAPLVRFLPEGSSMIAIDVASPFFAPFKLVMVLALLLAMPVVIYQLWAFVAPGLYRHEQRLARPLLVASVLLFYAGCAFAYFVVFPVIFGFFTAMAPEGVAVMTDINRYLDFVLVMFLAFGLAFQVPIVTFVVIALGITTPAQLAGIRGYVIIGAFTLAMLVTPPDMISQTLLAVPVLLLYEGGILMARLVLKPDGSPGDASRADSGEGSAG